MASNYLQPGDVLTLIAPYDVASGGGALVGRLFGVATSTVATGKPGEFKTTGVWLLPKTSAQAWTAGASIFWDNTNKRCDSDATVGPFIGAAVAAADNPSSTGYVQLLPPSSGAELRNVRQRFTIAQVNAGATLLPALPGKRYRLVDASAIAIGGAVAAVTTVDLLGTSTTSRKLVAWAQANLTQSALVRAGATGGTILADGASFAANDANTALTVGKTGSDVTTATHIDILVTYVVDAV